jgi:hypothetical protein
MPAIQQPSFGIARYALSADMGASRPAQSIAERIATATNGEIIVAQINQAFRSRGPDVVRGHEAKVAKQ